MMIEKYIEFTIMVNRGRGRGRSMRKGEKTTRKIN
jgi:hypothetical protein